MQQIVRDVFGFAGFRPHQAAAAAALAQGQDVQVVLPTGGGKSLCYQVPAIAAARAGRGPTLVVSPLIALMDDQVAGLSARGVQACALHSGIPWAAQRQLLRSLGEQVLIYASPERLKNKTLRRALCQRGVAHLVVDEAHCISEWGHEFRPEYRQLGPLRTELSAPVMAATATATARVLDDIAENLGMRSPVRIVAGVERPSLAFSVEHIRGDIARAERTAALLHEAGFGPRASPGRAVVYVATRKRAKAVSAALRAARLPATYYHAGRTARARESALAAFHSSQKPILVATSAFGMGIDLPDIRVVVHAQAPATLAAYYQQAGRAGRDGVASRCVLLSSPGDRLTHARIQGTSQRPGLTAGWRALGDYLYGGVCRQVMFADHFGVPGAPCGRCDVCRSPAAVAKMVAAARESGQARAEANRQRRSADRSVMLGADQDTQVVAFVGALSSPVGKRLVALGLRGSRAKAVLRKRLSENPHYGALTGVPEASIVLAIERLLRAGQLAPRGRKYPTVWLPGKSVRRAPSGPAKAARAARSPLERALRSLRQREAKRRRIKGYQVFPDRTLTGLVAARPRDQTQLGAVWGMGGKRLARYGDTILALVRDHAPEE